MYLHPNFSKSKLLIFHAKKARVLKDCYLESWLEYETKEKLEVAFELAQRLSPILDIFRWLPVLSNMDEVTRSNYIDRIPNLLREFLSTLEM